MRPVHHLAALLLLALLLTPLAVHPVPNMVLAVSNQEVEPAQANSTALTPYIEQEAFGATTNDSPETAERIGSLAAVRWTQTVTGTIGRGGDLDFYQFTLANPASNVQIRLSNLPADYDLILGGGLKLEDGELLPPAGFEPGLPGLEGITSIGGSIRSIGGSIRSIGGSIRSIGGSIRSIGGSIRSIGGSIRSISAVPGTNDELIDSFIWQPGIYFVAVGAANGESNEQPYQIDLRVDGSSLTIPPPSPEVEVNLALPWYASSPEDITTLYIYHPGRLASLYGEMGQMQVYTITEALMSLTGAYESAPEPFNLPREYGVILDLSQLTPVISNTQTITDVYALWDSNPANPFYANYIAGLIRNLIKAATAPAPGASGPNPAFKLDTVFEGTGVTFPKVRNIVLVGGDNVLPFFRLPDLTEIANEADYLAYTRSIYNQHMIDPDSPLGAALRYRMLLSDNPYGTAQPYDFYGAPLYLPQRAVGRIVEDPAQIADFLRTYRSDSPSVFQIDATAYNPFEPGRAMESIRPTQSITLPETFRPTRAFVSGYDFLIDQADAVTAVLQRTGLTSEDLTVLNNDDWSRLEIERDWFDGRLPEFVTPVPVTRTQIGLNSVNAHFDHWQLIPATEREGNFQALRLLSPEYDAFASYYSLESYFRTTLGYSVGCHSGYNMLDSSIILTDTRVIRRSVYQADFPQAFNRHGGNWIGNTGYGYGTADGVDYSERLAVLLTEELARAERGIEGSAYASIGEALMRAKQRYVRNATSLSEYDYKALSIMTLYGLPYMRVAVTNSLPPPPEDPQLNGNVPIETPAPLGTNEQGQLTRLITFTLTISNNDFVAIDRTGSRMLKLSPDNVAISDQFVDESMNGLGGARLADSSPFSQTVRIFENNQLGVPTLPTFAYDISALASDGTTPLKVRDVVFLGGVYGEIQGFDPQITQIVTETDTPIISTTTEPDFQAGVGIWFPDKFFSHSRVGVGELQRDQLVVAAAQFRANEDGVTGTLRPYAELSFRVLYEDPNEAPAELQADQTAPVIEAVRISDVVDGAMLANAQPRSRVEVRVSDDGPAGPNGSSLSEVSLVYIEDGTRWIERQLTEQTPGRYTVDLPLAAGDVRVIVRATDHAGNSSYFTAKGSFRLAQPEVFRVWISLISR